MKKREYVIERIVTIMIGLVFGLVMSWFIRERNQDNIMSVSQWATLLAACALVTEQFKANIAKLATTFLLATLIGSMVGVTLALTSKELLWLSATTILALIVILGYITSQKRKKQRELQDIIEAESEKCPYKVEGE